MPSQDPACHTMMPQKRGSEVSGHVQREGQGRREGRRERASEREREGEREGERERGREGARSLWPLASGILIALSPRGTALRYVCRGSEG